MTSLNTSHISLISHTHGRDRRETRGIERRELQAAIKHGRREEANPGPRGDQRWRFTYKGVVYITDATTRHEITSWREEGEITNPAEGAVPADMFGCHVVIIVDHSGSMRRDDVVGYSSRTEAVYTCLVRDLIEPHLDSAKAGEGHYKVVVSLIEMSDDAKVLFERQPLDSALRNQMKSFASRRARSHGNYLPALKEATRIMSESHNESKLMLVFLSDGAPSDHTGMVCEHGVEVWKQEEAIEKIKGKSRQKKGKHQLQVCPIGKGACRFTVKKKLNKECQNCIADFGNRFGKDRVTVAFCGFGGPSEDFSVLQSMSSKLPRGSFHKLGLSATDLTTVFSSMSSSLSTLRSEAIDVGKNRRKLTLRQNVDVRIEHEDLSDRKVVGKGWHLCLFNVKKFRYDETSDSLKEIPFGNRGIAFRKNPFASGAERLAHRGSEVKYDIRDDDEGEEDDDFVVTRLGPWIVTKQSKYKELLLNNEFHKTFCRLHFEAQRMADKFNSEMKSFPTKYQINFLQCTIYKLKLEKLNLSILAEPELVGKYRKFNNNAGGITTKKLQMLMEEDEEEDEEDYYDERKYFSFDVDDVPQAFSHYSFEESDYEKLVCDLQGTWNETDGFMLTDPVVQSLPGASNGNTDKGIKGMELFFESHRCSGLCRHLGLRDSYECLSIINEKKEERMKQKNKGKMPGHANFLGSKSKERMEVTTQEPEIDSPSYLVSDQDFSSSRGRKGHHSQGLHDTNYTPQGGLSPVNRSVKETSHDILLRNDKDYSEERAFYPRTRSVETSPPDILSRNVTQRSTEPNVGFRAKETNHCRRQLDDKLSSVQPRSQPSARYKYAHQTERYEPKLISSSNSAPVETTEERAFYPGTRSVEPSHDIMSRHVSQSSSMARHNMGFREKETPQGRRQLDDRLSSVQPRSHPSSQYGKYADQADSYYPTYTPQQEMHRPSIMRSSRVETPRHHVSADPHQRGFSSYERSNQEQPQNLDELVQLQQFFAQQVTPNQRQEDKGDNCTIM